MMSATTAHVNAAAALAQVRTRIEAESIRRRRWTLPRAFVMRNRLRGSAATVVAACALAGAVLWTPAGSLAQDLITVFQPSKIVAVQVGTSDLQTLQELSSYGTFSPPPSSGSRQPAAGFDDAQARSGMTLVSPHNLPADIPPAASYDVMPATTLSFTFSAARAAATAAAHGHTLPPMPAGMDGSALEVTTGVGVLTTFQRTGADLPSLLIGQMKSPVIRATGVPVGALENYLLSLPGISPELAAQIRAIGDPTTALPLPILSDRSQSHSVTVHGVQGIAVSDATGIGSGVIWQKDGIVYGVAAPMPESRLLQIAESLR